jgi:hypothetical protein
MVITPVNYSLAAVRDRSILTRRGEIAYPAYIITLGKLLRWCLWVGPAVQDLGVRLSIFSMYSYHSDPPC